MAWTGYDPTLFLFVPFLFRAALDDPQIAEARAHRVLGALSRQTSIPEQKQLPRHGHRPDDDILHRRWQNPAGDPTLSGGWSIKTFGFDYHETLDVLLGVERHCDEGVQAADLAQWIGEARECWVSAFEADESWPPPAIDKNHDALGMVWLWTGEWAEPPSGGWEQFAETRYPGGSVVFPWGVLGYRPGVEALGGKASLDCFELHTARAADQKRGRDKFLLTSLIIILTEFLKTTQYLWPRYLMEDEPPMLRYERTIMEARPYPTTQENIRKLYKSLFPLTQALGNLKHDQLSAQIARDAIGQQLRASEGVQVPGAGGMQLTSRVERIAEQMASDAAYFETAKQCGEATSQALELEVGINDTRSEHMMLLGHVLIAALGVGFGAAVIAWEVVKEVVPKDSPTIAVLKLHGLAALLITILVFAVSTYLSWEAWIQWLPAQYARVHHRLERHIQDAGK